MGNAQNITFSLAHNLINARMWHETQPLPDGNFILFGGYNGDEVNPVSYQSSEIYNYKNKTIQIGPSMNIPRYDFNSLVLHDGNIMALGGNNSSNQGILSCEIFDLLSNSWILVSSMQERHVGGKAIKLRDGRVLLVGGSTVTSEIYNSYTKLWSKVGPMNSIHGGGMTLTLLDGGQVLATGGETNPTSLELFDPSTNLWSKLPFTSIYKHQNHLAINLGGGGVLLAGSSYPDVVDQLGTEIVNPENSATIIKTGNLLGDVSFGRTVLLQNGAAFTYGIG